MEMLLFVLQNKNIIISLYRQLQKERLFQKLEDMFQNVCSIKFDSVANIRKLGKEKVYDITVDDTHCFFANDILVKNCQHWAAQTCQVISDFSISARYRFATSATPFRDLADDILIDACFGKKLADINASYLIREGFLIKPTIYMVPISNARNCPFKSYPKVYRQAITDNPVRNQMIADMAIKFAEQGRVVLVLCKHIVHGKMLESLIPGSIFLRGETTSKKRKEHLDKMRRREACITIASVIFDEGIDVRCLDTLILSGSGKSKTRALQRVGRILRPYDGKTDAIAVDFIDHAKHVLSHSRARQAMYESEPEFIVKKMDI
jgi:superfamily II DNA or RNA helicase